MATPLTDANQYQQMLNAVASVLKLEVTLVDDRLVRVAGTGMHGHRAGEQVHPDSAFGQTLRSGTVVKVVHPRLDPVCLGCGARGACQETAHVATPIWDEDRVIGVMGLIAFTDEQREQLLIGLDRYVDFLAIISDLIASKLREAKMTSDLLTARGSLHAIAHSVAEGVVAFDQAGAITFVNDRARAILGLAVADAPRGLPDLEGLAEPVQEVLAGGAAASNRELSVRPLGRKAVRVVGNIQPILAGGRVAGAVASLRDIRDVYDLVYRMDADQPLVNFDRMVYRSPAMAAVVGLARRVSANPSTVLIRGESGTGKELLARAVHANSPRRDRPFIALNCAAIPEDLLESELFGYADGAFTGARRGGKPGKFELANRGTLFLDEIGDMSLRLQAKLLRVLQASEVVRLGGTEAMNLDVRIITATHQNLEEMIGRREFREDLYFRINVIPLEIPPLRQRDQDIPILLEHFRLSKGPALNPGVTAFSREAAAMLLGYGWPGNVRELENAVEYALTMAAGPVITPDCLPARVTRAAGAPAETSPAVQGLTPVAELTRRELERGLALYGVGDRAAARMARELGLSRATVYRRLREYGMLKEGVSS